MGTIQNACMIHKELRYRTVQGRKILKININLMNLLIQMVQNRAKVIYIFELYKMREVF
jgi:hypothetical protein